MNPKSFDRRPLEKHATMRQRRNAVSSKSDELNREKSMRVSCALRTLNIPKRSTGKFGTPNASNVTGTEHNLHKTAGMACLQNQTN
jgi:hypothetical protein